MGPAHPLAGNVAWAIGLLIGITALAATTLLLVFVAKARRDRAERRSVTLRAALVESLQAGDGPRLRALTAPMHRHHLNDQADLLAVLSAHGDDPWWTEDTTATLRDALGGPAFVAVLERQLNSRNAAMRGTALLLGSHPSCRLPAFLVARHFGDADATVRLAAAAALEREATPEAAETLVDGLEAHALPDARIVERLGHAWAVPTCRSRMRTCDPERTGSARGSLARALGLAADPSAVMDLLWLLGVGGEEESVQALRALAACSATASPEQRAWIAEAARDRLGSGHGATVLMACEALAASGDDGDIPRFAALMSHPDWHVRRAAARALAAHGEPGIDVLRAVASGPDRYAADRAREELAIAEGQPGGS